MEKGNTTKRSLADLLPLQDHYYLLTDGTKYAHHGTQDANGLLVFANLERAEQFCMTVGKGLPTFVPVKVPLSLFMDIVEEIGAVCVTEGLSVRVGTMANNHEAPDVPTRINLDFCGRN